MVLRLTKSAIWAPRGEVKLFSPGIHFLTRTALSLTLALTTVSAVAAKDNPTDAAFKKGEAVVSTEKKTENKKFVKGRVLINASPHVVWESVHEERKHDPDLEYSKLLEEKANVKMLEQKFNLIPVIGSATCLMKQDEVVNERIDYTMVKSDRFKAFEGSWVLTPTEDGKGTILELTSYIDMGLPIPRGLMENFQGKKLGKRLSNVKKMAETIQSKQLATK